MPDAGSWPDWIGSSVAFVALLVAAIAAWATVKTNQAQLRAIEIQRQGLEDVRLQRKREQADRFMVWYQDGVYKFANLSDRPVFGVTIVVSLEEDPTQDEFIFKLDRSRELENPILPDGAIHHLPLRWQLQPESVLIYFIDASGNHWRIDDHPGQSRTAHEVSREEAEKALEKYPFYVSQEELVRIQADPDSHRH